MEKPIIIQIQGVLEYTIAKTLTTVGAEMPPDGIEDLAKSLAKDPEFLKVAEKMIKLGDSPRT